LRGTYGPFRFAPGRQREARTGLPASADFIYTILDSAVQTNKGMHTKNGL